ncbi:major facilitator superfamily domain-containing protein [Elsinoe ampelina]|uniref:Major facilitator superfamily domain-containing protein n=1 Tax=Elsinoe ampelina TaxID=302913 RepID=A0A6A6GN42_9PEZI|nr:major facilitator superfamily domain-containing protein [Elsinoe ampelina]
MSHSVSRDIELTSDVVADRTPAISYQDTTTADEPQFNEQHLAPVDGGRAAWKLLVTAFVFEALLWGFPLSFGVFQEYYSRQPEFRDNRYISVVGTVATGLSYLGAPLTIPIIKRFQKYQRHMIWIGCTPLCILGLVAGSFASTLEYLILSKGVLYGLGFLIFYYPILSMVNEYWIQRRGMAYGLLCSATGLSGTVLPLLTETLLNRYGHRTTLRIMAVSLTILTGPLIPFLKPRLPASHHTTSQKTDWSFLRSPLFHIYSLSNILQGLAYFLPALYLPSTATTLGSSPRIAALLLTTMSLAQTIGQFLFGYLSDLLSRPSPSHPPSPHSTPPSSPNPDPSSSSPPPTNNNLNLLLALTTLISSLSLPLWALPSSLPPLFLFAALYGLFATAFTALWARMASSVTANPGTTPMVFALFNAGKGVGNVLSGPISAGLLRAGRSGDQRGAGKGGFVGVVGFTGGMMLLSALVMGGWWAGGVMKGGWQRVGSWVSRMGRMMG